MHVIRIRVANVCSIAEKQFRLWAVYVIAMMTSLAYDDDPITDD